MKSLTARLASPTVAKDSLAIPIGLPAPAAADYPSSALMVKVSALPSDFLADGLTPVTLGEKLTGLKFRSTTALRTGYHGPSAHVTRGAYMSVDVNHTPLSAVVNVSVGAAPTAAGSMAHDGASPSQLQAAGLSSFVLTTGGATVADSAAAGTASPVTESMSVATDKADYAPGNTATIIVTGVNSGSSIAFQIADLASDPGIDGIADAYASFSVTDGGIGDSDGLANGVVVTQWQVPSDGSATGATLQLTATSGSQIATTTFSDAPNKVVLENQQTGTPQSVWAIHGSIDNIGDSQIEGFATQISTNAGQTVSFKIKASSGYTLDVYRLGYYDGNGARLVASTHHTGSTNQPNPIFRDSTNTVDAGNWSVTDSWSIPSNAVSGVYFAKLTTDTGDRQNTIPFIVRNDGAPTDILFQTSDTTWEAYNPWGGYNLYQGPGGRDDRAYAVSYNRPIMMNSGAISSGPQDYLFGEEYAAIYWLERNGYDVSYISGIDAATNAALLLNTKAYIDVGHDEYWSQSQYTNVKAAAGAGVDLAFLSGNEVYWDIELAPSLDASAMPNRTIVEYKDIWSGTQLDPNGTSNGGAGLFRDPVYGFGKPENSLTGTIFTVDSWGGLDNITIPASMSQYRFWANTPIASGNGGTLTNLLGYEWDSDLDNGFRPAGLIDLSSTTRNVSTLLFDNGLQTGPGTATHSLTLYRNPSGALVFGAGTVMWSWGLSDQYVPYNGNTAPVSAAVQQSMANLFADMGVQPQTLMQGLAVATQSTDHTAPTSTITSPTASGSFTAAQPITIAGTATDAGGGSVAVVEVSTDSGTSWHRVSGRENWTYTWVPLAGGSYTIKSRAVDDSVNMETPGSGTTISVAAAPTVSLFSASDVPAITNDIDPGLVNLGVKFTSSQSGSIVGLRYYKGLGDGGTHVGSLWSSTGTLLASATFTQETASGWQTVTFTNPVSIAAGTTYVASYHSNSHYADTENYFTTAHSSGSLTAQVGNGYYTYGNTVAFPTTASNGVNYWVDVIFSPANTANQPPVGVNDSGFAVTQDTSKTFAASDLLANDTDPNGDILSITSVDMASGGAVSFNSQTNSVTFTPNVGYTGPASFRYSISDGRGGTSSAIVSMTVVPPSNNVSLFSSSDIPAVLSDADSLQLNLGVRFTSSADGTITGIKYYKGANDTGTHTGSLWSSTGTLLATVTFTNESTNGWQTVTFSSPVSITAGTTYVASFHSNGHYTSTGNYFTTPHVNGVLTAATNNGVYTYGNDNLFPTGTYAATNYWVDVLFSSATANHAPSAVNDSGF